MADKTPWHLKGSNIELCNCDPGCGCNFRGFPSSKEGNCEAFVGFVFDEGRYGDVDLAGSKVAWALWWPKAVHEGGGRAHAYVDCATDEQFDALARIWRGEAGYDYFEIFNSTFVEPTTVERAAIDLKLDGKNSSFSVKGVGEVIMTPLRNPVSGDENPVRIVNPGAFIWKDGEIAQGERLKVDLPDIKFDHTGRHGVFAAVEWSNP
jgi:hypothetical protein